MRSLKGQRVLVVGLGLFGGGLGVTRYLCRQGARVTVTDLRSADDLRESVDGLGGYSVALKLGGHDEDDFRRADLIVASPAVPRALSYLQIAEAAGVPVTTEICLAVERCPAPILGITGSSGKTTTACLVADMLQQVDSRTIVGGNIGGSLLDRLETITPDTPVVLELSSFQLDRLGDLPWSPHIAVVTNFAPNHIDVHGSLDAYRDAKRQIVINQGREDTAILNADDGEVARWSELGEGAHASFSMEGRVEPGVFCREGHIRHTLGGSERVVCPTTGLALPGRHNLANALAASAGALCWGSSEDQISAVLRDFGGVEHRLERVGEVNGVAYYNDSIATSPDRTQVALEAFQGPVVLIAGGYDKGLAFDGLGPTIGRKVSHLILLGATAEAIAASIPPRALTRVNRVQSLKEALVAASSAASPGDVVLLSPACASYDMFRNFEERGRLFKRLVDELAMEGS